MIKWLKLTVSQVKAGIKIVRTAIVTKLKSWMFSLKKLFSKCKFLTSIKKWILHVWENLNTKIFTKKPFVFVKKVVTILVFLFSLFLIIDPFMPEFGFRIRHALNVPYKEEQVVVEEESREINSLVIPVIGVDIPIVEGATDKALRDGAWRRPESGTPDKGGNTVITGHRYQYVPPNNKTFYNLDKLEIGQLMYVYWNEEKYVYEVFDTFIVDPTQVEIEDPLDGNILTVYTCHPLWTADKRYVVRGRLVTNEQLTTNNEQ